MAFEIVEITLAGGDQKITRTQRVPVGSSFSDLGLAVQTAMGWNGGEIHRFRIPGAGAEIDDESIPMSTYGRLPVEYIYGGLVHKIRFLGESKRDFSGGWFSDHRSESRSEAVRGCVRTWYDKIATSRYLDSKAVDDVADAIASSRRKDLYLDLRSMKVVDEPVIGSTVLIRPKESDFLLKRATAFVSSWPSMKMPDPTRKDWHQRFIGDVSRSSKISRAWSEYIKKESRSEAESWAENNGIWTSGGSGSTMSLPCMTCGELCEAKEDRTIGNPAMLGRPRFPMVVECPDCGTTTQLFMFNDGFVTDYCFRKDNHPCWTTRDAILAKRRADAESDPVAKARLLLLAALDLYRCDRLEEASSLIEESSGILPGESAAVGSFIRGEECPDCGDIDPIFAPIRICNRIRAASSAAEAESAFQDLEESISEADVPEWLKWEIRGAAVSSPTEDCDKAAALGRMKEVLSDYLDRLRSAETVSSDDYRRACGMFEIAVRYAFDELSLKDAGPLIDTMCGTFSDGGLENPTSKAVALYRRGLYRIIVGGDDDGAVSDLVDVVMTMLSNEGRGPVTGRRAFAAMCILYMYDPDSMDLVTLALNSMNAMSVMGGFTAEELQEMESVIARILKAIGGYEEARLEVRSRTNIDLGPEPEEGISLEDLMDIRCSYFLT